MKTINRRRDPSNQRDTKWGKTLKKKKKKTHSYIQSFCRSFLFQDAGEIGVGHIRKAKTFTWNTCLHIYNACHFEHKNSSNAQSTNSRMPLCPARHFKICSASLDSAEMFAEQRTVLPNPKSKVWCLHIHEIALIIFTITIGKFNHSVWFLCASWSATT